MDNIIHHRRNNIGFRGPDFPPDPENYIKIFTIGGSTTECFYISDGKTWSDVLLEELRRRCSKKIWLNNAGLDGHSTRGHIVLLREHILKYRPDYIVFLVGVNDIGLDDGDDFADSKNRNHIDFKRMIVLSAKYSRVMDVLVNLYRVYKAKKMKVHHGTVDVTKYHLKDLSIDPENIRKINKTNEKYLIGYRSRIETLINMCLKNNITPIFLTQPLLYGKGKDPITGVDLERISLGEYTGAERWYEMELYNRELLEVCHQYNITCIDLANKLEKRSDYFYDFVHYTNKGARQIGMILAEELYPVICKD